MKRLLRWLLGLEEPDAGVPLQRAGYLAGYADGWADGWVAGQVGGSVEPAITRASEDLIDQLRREGKM